ncbi:ribonuclease E, partial [Vibrio sp. 10N.261.48.A2]
EQEEPKQRRNRRSPRHLRASGQRRRRGRDRRPNPFRLRKGGVASPEMAMGKVMPRFIPKPHHNQAKPEVAEVQVAVETQVAVQEQNVAQETAPQSNTAIAGGFACPELAMGKVIIRREEAEAPKAESVKVEEAPVVKVEAPKAAPKAAVAKKQAGSPMTKAPGPQEIKEIQVVAAPFRTERFVSKGAGSQAASNKAGAGMTKPQY